MECQRLCIVFLLIIWKSVILSYDPCLIFVPLVSHTLWAPLQSWPCTAPHIGTRLRYSSSSGSTRGQGWKQCKSNGNGAFISFKVLLVFCCDITIYDIHRGNKESTCLNANGYNFRCLFSNLPRSPFPGGSSSSASSGALTGAKKMAALNGYVSPGWISKFLCIYIYIIYLFPFCFWSQGLGINFQCLEKTEDSDHTFCWMITGKAAAKRAAGGGIWRCFVGYFI